MLIFSMHVALQHIHKALSITSERREIERRRILEYVASYEGNRTVPHFLDLGPLVSFWVT